MYEKVIEGEGYDVVKREDGTYCYLIGNEFKGSYSDPEDAEFAALEYVSWMGFQGAIEYRIIDNWTTWEIDDLLHSSAMWAYAVNNIWNDELTNVHQKLIDAKQFEKWHRVIKFGVTHWCPDQLCVETIVGLNKSLSTGPEITDIIVYPVGESETKDGGFAMLLTMLDKSKF